MHRGAYTDSRLMRPFGDPRVLLTPLQGKFDAVFADLPDALSGTNTTRLFTREFYGAIQRLLTEQGVFATQAGAAHLRDCSFFASVVHTLQSVFRYAVPYVIDVPSYGVPWGFVLASDGLDVAVWDEI